MTAIASRSQLRMSLLRYALVTVPLILVLGVASGRLADSGYGNPWFDALVKPRQMPPGVTFAIVWPILYVFQGFAIAMILHARGARGRVPAIALFCVQLLLNLAWSPVFFGAHLAGLALGILGAMLVLVTATIVLFAGIRKGAALLMLPYLAWLCFATYLNFEIVTLNPGGVAPSAGSADIAL